MHNQLNIVIADEDPEFILLLKELCSTIKGINPPHIARSHRMLLAKARIGKQDLVLLDITHGMGGIDIIDTMHKIDPGLNIIVTYDPENHDSDILVSALEMGAYECIEKPPGIESRQFNEFRLHLLTIIGLLRARKRFAKKGTQVYKNKFFMPQKKADKPVANSFKPSATLEKIDIVVIASSTGGPEILSQIFSILPGDLKIPILLVQHIPEDMTQFFAKSMNEKSELEILQANQGDEVLPAKVYLAPGGQHMTVSKPDAMGKRILNLNNKPPVNSVRPSADILFESIARSYNGNILAVILTGMGDDSKKGVAALKEKGCVCITQKAETCVVYGMPRSVDEAGLSDESLDPLSITQKIVLAGQKNICHAI